VKAFVYLTAAVLAVIGIGIGLSASSWQKPSLPAHNMRLSEFKDSSVRFDYPSSWTAAVIPDSTMFTSAAVFLSHEANPRCAARYGITRSVSLPGCGLGSDGVLVEWSFGGFPLWTLARTPGQRVTVDGQPGKQLSVSGGGSCVTGTQESVTLLIARPVPYNFYEMNACLRGPDLAQGRSEIQAMITSAKILQP